MSDVLPHHLSRLRATDALIAQTAVTASRGLSRVSPGTLRSILATLARGARPATYDEARTARDTVLIASPYSRGGSACLPRSLATALVCRRHGTWPDWCVGVLSAPPFTAHAWIEVDGAIVDEPVDGADFSTFYTVSAPPMTSTHETAPAAAELGRFAERTGLGFGDQAENWTPFADRWA